MKKEDMKNKTIVIVDYEKIFPEVTEDDKKKSDGVISYFLNKDIIVKADKAKVYFIESKRDPIDGIEICKFYYELEDGTKKVLRIKPKTQFEEILPNIYIEDSLLYLKDQVISLLNS